MSATLCPVNHPKTFKWLSLGSCHKNIFIFFHILIRSKNWKVHDADLALFDPESETVLISNWYNWRFMVLSFQMHTGSILEGPYSSLLDLKILSFWSQWSAWKKKYLRSYFELCTSVSSSRDSAVNVRESNLPLHELCVQKVDLKAFFDQSWKIIICNLYPKLQKTSALF